MASSLEVNGVDQVGIVADEEAQLRQELSLGLQFCEKAHFVLCRMKMEPVFEDGSVWLTTDTIRFYFHTSETCRGQNLIYFFDFAIFGSFFQRNTLGPICRKIF